jgi:ketosteroid isomerase-like protein
MPETTDALALAQQLVEGLRRLDHTMITPLLDKDILLEVPFPLVEGEDRTGARRSRGPAVTAYLHQVCAACAEIRFENVVWRTADDGVALFQADGVIKLANGGAYNNHYLMMFEARDGKIVRWREYLSPVIWARSAGAPLESLPS